MVPPSSSTARQATPKSDADTKAASAPSLYNPLFYLARFALTLAPSALMGAGLVPLLAEPRAVVAAQADDQFKVGARLGRGECGSWELCGIMI